MIPFPDEHEEVSMRTLSCIAVVLGVLVAAIAVPSAALAADTPSTGKVYELRIYKTNPGKLEALHARFREHACPLFKKHGIELVGFWTPTDGDEAKDTLYYIIAFPSVKAQKEAWQAFKSDPEWIKAKADSEKDGVLVKQLQSKNMKATDYSPIQ
jgi:hypothetical protein